jgi:hypothetical protein
MLVTRRQPKNAQERETVAVAARRAAHPYASAVEVAEVRAAERGKDLHTVPYFDVTVSTVKSVSVLHASYRVGARQARGRGDEEQAATLDARAEEIEDALAESAREAVGCLEQHATYTRTGPPFSPDGGVAGRRRPGGRHVPESHQPQRAAAGDVSTVALVGGSRLRSRLT